MTDPGYNFARSWVPNRELDLWVMRTFLDAVERIEGRVPSDAEIAEHGLQVQSPPRGRADDVPNYEPGSLYFFWRGEPAVRFVVPAGAEKCWISRPEPFAIDDCPEIVLRELEKLHIGLGR